MPKDLPKELIEEPVASDHANAVARFDTPNAAETYSERLIGTTRDEREKRSILHALQNAPHSGKVLDLPCGTGRLVDVLLDQQFAVHEADSSTHMLERAKHRWTALKEEQGVSGNVTFSVENVLNTSFPDKHFDAVVCNRLFHHFGDPATRIRALAELARISRELVVVSFFNVATWRGLRAVVRDRLQNRIREDRFCIRLDVITAEAREAGLELIEALPSRGRLSPQWYLALTPVSA